MEDRLGKIFCLIPQNRTSHSKVLLKISILKKIGKIFEK